MFSPMFPSLGEFMEGAAKKSAGADPSNNSSATKTPKKTSSSKKLDSSKDLCHQAPVLVTAPATPPQSQAAADLTTPPVAVVHTGKKKSRTVAKGGDNNRDNGMVSGSGGSGTTLTSATTDTTCTDEVSPMGSEGADESVPTSSPTNLEKILGMEDDIAPTSMRPSKGSKSSKPPKTSRRSNRSSKNNNAKKRQGAAAAQSALPFLLGYEQMVRTQDAEDWATAAHLRPIFAKLRYLGGDTTVAPAVPSSHKTSNTPPASIMSSSDASVTSTGTYGTTPTTMTDRTDAEREADALSYLSSYSGQHVDKCDDGTIRLSFDATAVSLSILSSRKPNEEEMVLDRSLMLLLQTIVEATAEMEDIGSGGGVSFPEFLHSYKTITTAMQTIQRFPSTTAEGQHHKAQTRDRAHQMIQSFVCVPSAIPVPAGVEEPKDRGSAKDEDDVEEKQNGKPIDAASIAPTHEKEIASTNPIKAVLLHVIVALVCGTSASVMWAKYVPPRNMSSPADANINHETKTIAVEEEEAEEEAQMQQVPPFNQRSVEHFALRKEIRTIGARSKRWMQSAHACQESLETTQAEFEEASLTIMEIIDKNEMQPGCSPPEKNSDDTVMNVVVPADVPQSMHVSKTQAQQQGHARMHILSAMGGATLTTASKVLVGGSVKVVSATSSPLALVVETIRSHILSALGGATMSSLASRALVEGTTKVATGTAANSLAMTRVVSAAIGSPFALVMTVGIMSFVIASVRVHAAGNDGDSIDV